MPEHIDGDELFQMPTPKRRKKLQRIERRDKRYQERLARKFIGSDLGYAVNDHHDWVGKEILGRSGFGAIGIWARVNADNIIEEV